MKYKVRINQTKLNQLKEQLKPGYSWWAFIGIAIFFFLPEVVALFWGDEITKFFIQKEQLSTDSFSKLLYGQLKSLGENSILNLTIGLIFLFWFFKGRREYKKRDIKPPKVNL